MNEEAIKAILTLENIKNIFTITKTITKKDKQEVIQQVIYEKTWVNTDNREEIRNNLNELLNEISNSKESVNESENDMDEEKFKELMLYLSQIKQNSSFKNIKEVKDLMCVLIKFYSIISKQELKEVLKIKLGEKKSVANSASTPNRFMVGQNFTDITYSRATISEKDVNNISKQYLNNIEGKDDITHQERTEEDLRQTNTTESKSSDSNNESQVTSTIEENTTEQEKESTKSIPEELRFEEEQKAESSSTSEHNSIVSEVEQQDEIQQQNPIDIEKSRVNAPTTVSQNSDSDSLQLDKSITTNPTRENKAPKTKNEKQVAKENTAAPYSITKKQIATAIKQRDFEFLNNKQNELSTFFNDKKDDAKSLFSQAIIKLAQDNRSNDERRNDKSLRIDSSERVLATMTLALLETDSKNLKEKDKREILFDTLLSDDYVKESESQDNKKTIARLPYFMNLEKKSLANTEENVYSSRSLQKFLAKYISLGTSFEADDKTKTISELWNESNNRYDEIIKLKENIDEIKRHIKQLNTDKLSLDDPYFRAGIAPYEAQMKCNRFSKLVSEEFKEKEKKEEKEEKPLLTNRDMKLLEIGFLLSNEDINDLKSLQKSQNLIELKAAVESITGANITGEESTIDSNTLGSLRKLYKTAISFMQEDKPTEREIITDLKDEILNINKEVKKTVSSKVNNTENLSTELKKLQSEEAELMSEKEDILSKIEDKIERLASSLLPKDNIDFSAMINAAKDKLAEERLEVVVNIENNQSLSRDYNSVDSDSRLEEFIEPHKLPTNTKLAQEPQTHSRSKQPDEKAESQHQTLESNNPIFELNQNFKLEINSEGNVTNKTKEILKYIKNHVGLLEKSGVEFSPEFIRLHKYLQGITIDKLPKSRKNDVKIHHYNKIELQSYISICSHLITELTSQKTEDKKEYVKAGIDNLNESLATLATRLTTKKNYKNIFNDNFAKLGQSHLLKRVARIIEAQLGTKDPLEELGYKTLQDKKPKIIIKDEINTENGYTTAQIENIKFKLEVVKEQIDDSKALHEEFHAVAGVLIEKYRNKLKKAEQSGNNKIFNNEGENPEQFYDNGLNPKFITKYYPIAEECYNLFKECTAEGAPEEVNSTFNKLKQNTTSLVDLQVFLKLINKHFTLDETNEKTAELKDMIYKHLPNTSPAGENNSDIDPSKYYKGDDRNPLYLYTMTLAELRNMIHAKTGISIPEDLKKESDDEDKKETMEHLKSHMRKLTTDEDDESIPYITQFLRLIGVDLFEIAKDVKKGKSKSRVNTTVVNINEFHIELITSLIESLSGDAIELKQIIQTDGISAKEKLELIVDACKSILKIKEKNTDSRTVLLIMHQAQVILGDIYSEDNPQYVDIAANLASWEEYISTNNSSTHSDIVIGSKTKSYSDIFTSLKKNKLSEEKLDNIEYLENDHDSLLSIYKILFTRISILKEFQSKESRSENQVDFIAKALYLNARIIKLIEKTKRKELKEFHRPKITKIYAAKAKTALSNPIVNKDKNIESMDEDILIKIINILFELDFPAHEMIETLHNKGIDSFKRHIITYIDTQFIPTGEQESLLNELKSFVEYEGNELTRDKLTNGDNPLFDPSSLYDDEINGNIRLILQLIKDCNREELNKYSIAQYEDKDNLETLDIQQIYDNIKKVFKQEPNSNHLPEIILIHSLAASILNKKTDSHSNSSNISKQRRNANTNNPMFDDNSSSSESDGFTFRGGVNYQNTKYSNNSILKANFITVYNEIKTHDLSMRKFESLNLDEKFKIKDQLDIIYYIWQDSSELCSFYREQLSLKAKNIESNRVEIVEYLAKLYFVKETSEEVLLANNYSYDKGSDSDNYADLDENSQFEEKDKFISDNEFVIGLILTKIEKLIKTFNKENYTENESKIILAYENLLNSIVDDSSLQLRNTLNSVLAPCLDLSQTTNIKKQEQLTNDICNLINLLLNNEVNNGHQFTGSGKQKNMNSDNPHYQEYQDGPGHQFTGSGKQKNMNSDNPHYQEYQDGPGHQFTGSENHSMNSDNSHYQEYQDGPGHQFTGSGKQKNMNSDNPHFTADDQYTVAEFNTGDKYDLTNDIDLTRLRVDIAILYKKLSDKYAGIYKGKSHKGKNIKLELYSYTEVFDLMFHKNNKVNKMKALEKFCDKLFNNKFMGVKEYNKKIRDEFLNSISENPEDSAEFEEISNELKEKLTLFTAKFGIGIKQKNTKTKSKLKSKNKSTLNQKFGEKETLPFNYAEIQKRLIENYNLTRIDDGQYQEVDYTNQSNRIYELAYRYTGDSTPTLSLWDVNEQSDDYLKKRDDNGMSVLHYMAANPNPLKFEKIDNTTVMGMLEVIDLEISYLQQLIPYDIFITSLTKEEHASADEHYNKFLLQVYSSAYQDTNDKEIGMNDITEEINKMYINFYNIYKKEYNSEQGLDDINKFLTGRYNTLSKQPCFDDINKIINYFSYLDEVIGDNYSRANEKISKIDIQDKYGLTPSHIAAESGNLVLSHYIAKHKASNRTSVNRRNSQDLSKLSSLNIENSEVINLFIYKDNERNDSDKKFKAGTLDYSYNVDTLLLDELMRTINAIDNESITSKSSSISSEEFESNTSEQTTSTSSEESNIEEDEINCRFSHPLDIIDDIQIKDSLLGELKAIYEEIVSNIFEKCNLYNMKVSVFKENIIEEIRVYNFGINPKFAGIDKDTDTSLRNILLSFTPEFYEPKLSLNEIKTNHISEHVKIQNINFKEDSLVNYIRYRKIDNYLRLTAPKGTLRNFNTQELIIDVMQSILDNINKNVQFTLAKSKAKENATGIEMHSITLKVVLNEIKKDSGYIEKLINDIIISRFKINVNENSQLVDKIKKNVTMLIQDMEVTEPKQPQMNNSHNQESSKGVNNSRVYEKSMSPMIIALLNENYEIIADYNMMITSDLDAACPRLTFDILAFIDNNVNTVLNLCGFESIIDVMKQAGNDLREQRMKINKIHQSRAYDNSVELQNKVQHMEEQYAKALTLATESGIFDDKFVFETLEKEATFYNMYESFTAKQDSLEEQDKTDSFKNAFDKIATLKNKITESEAKLQKLSDKISSLEEKIGWSAKYDSLVWVKSFYNKDVKSLREHKKESINTGKEIVAMSLEIKKIENMFANQNYASVIDGLGKLKTLEFDFSEPQLTGGHSRTRNTRGNSVLPRVETGLRKIGSNLAALVKRGTKNSIRIPEDERTSPGL